LGSNGWDPAVLSRRSAYLWIAILPILPIVFETRSLRSAVVKETLLCLDVLLARRASEFKEFVSSDTSSLFYALLEKSSFDKKFVMSSARNTLSLL
jgi:hypothetical protein